MLKWQLGVQVVLGSALVVAVLMLWKQSVETSHLVRRQMEANGKEVMNFWSLEKPRFAIEQGPKWLTIDQATGVLSGTPDAAGKVEVVITASIDRDVRKVARESRSP